MALEKSLRRRKEKDDGTDHLDPEIAETSRYQASLGLNLKLLKQMLGGWFAAYFEG